MRKLLLFLLAPLLLSSWDDTPRCFKELETNFFEANTVKQAMDLHIIYQSQWVLIYDYLSAGSQRVPQMLKERTRRMKPSPFQHPFDGEKAKEMLLDVLYQIFREAMHERLVTDEDAIQEMFRFIVAHQGKLDACLAAKKAEQDKRKKLSEKRSSK